MSRTAIKNFAVWARKSLRDEVATNAARLGINRTRITEPQYVAGGMVIGAATFDQPTTTSYRALRDDLNVRLKSKPLELVVDELVDEMAYTWFNRLAALRFMEVKGYIGRALSSSVPGTVEPDLLRDALSLVDTLPGLDTERIDALQAEGEEPLYRALLVAQCKDLAKALPELFGRTAYAELFLPARLLTQGSFIQRLVQDIPVEDWQDIEIVGWLYQFYISERKAEVFEQFKNKPYEARDIPAATQLFTPHWIVRYMVENSLGRLWLEAHPESNLRAQMPYYLVSEQPGEPVAPNPQLTPEDLSVLDPACGSGHILVYAFDLLFAIYQEQGYPEPGIPALILEHNLHGLDIDERAAQLASFALMMKAREKSRRVLRSPPKLNVTHTASTRDWALPDTPELKRGDWQPLLDAFRNADNLGSLISPPEVDEEALGEQLEAYEVSGRLEASAYAPKLRQFLEQASLLSRQYQAVVANPPYMGNKSLNKELKTFAETNYAPYKHDLFSVSVARYLKFCEQDGHLGFMTPFVWMFISSYEPLRRKIIDEHTLSSLVQLEYSGFDGATVPICTYTLRKRHIPNYVGDFVRLSDFRGAANQGPKTLEAAADPNCSWRYRAKPEDFEKIPGSPIAYWVSERVLSIFDNKTPLESVAAVRVGLNTGENDRFLRYWFEPNLSLIGFSYTSEKDTQVNAHKWFPYNKGGDFRKWYGNRDYVVDWSNGGRAIWKRGNVRAISFQFAESITWSFVSSAYFGVRYSPLGSMFDVGGSSVFPNRLSNIYALTAFLCSRVASELLKALNPTLNFQVGNVASLPLDVSNVSTYTVEFSKRCIEISKTDWDNFETSWDFQTHPLHRTPHSLLANAFADWQETAATAFAELKRLEAENNRYWIDAYGLQDELTPDVPDGQITVRRANLTRDVKSLLSFAVGCMMGRYSLSQPGLQFAGGTFDPSRFSGDFLPDPDGILPITDEAYFDDDIVARFEAFLRAAYGAESLQANLVFIADALTCRSDETPRERVRRYFLDEFISDHIQTYKKRPIYWLFTSGRENGFGALVYLHRYTPDTLATMRNDYVLELQGKLAAELDRVERSREGASARDAKLAERRLKKLRAQQTEVVGFQERLQTLADQHIELDLDDGVAYNYTRFQGLLYEGPDLKMVDLIKKSAWKRELLEQTS